MLCFCQFLLKCSQSQDVAGTSALDSTDDLLAMLDAAATDEGIKFNGPVLRRALKARANTDFKHQRWESLTTTTLELVFKRFIPEEDQVDAAGFYTLLCSQVWQKLLKTATSSTKSKDTMCADACNVT